jgi:hypothetical protein
MSSWTALRLGLRRDRLARLDLETVTLPDTAAAREAEAVADGFPAHLRNHSQRSYLWALALGEQERLAYDAEFLYCACLLHDAGLVGRGERGGSECFTWPAPTRRKRASSGPPGLPGVGGAWRRRSPYT